MILPRNPSKDYLKQPFSIPEITDKDELAEIEKIRTSLVYGEKVLLVIKQMQNLSGGNTIFATNTRFIIKNSILVYAFGYNLLSDVRLTMEPHSYSLEIKIHNTSYSDETISNLKKMMETHGQIVWKDNKGFINRIPRNKGELLFKIAKREIQKINGRNL